MDLNTITEVKRPSSADEIARWREGYAWLAGGHLVVLRRRRCRPTP